MNVELEQRTTVHGPAYGVNMHEAIESAHRNCCSTDARSCTDSRSGGSGSGWDVVPEEGGRAPDLKAWHAFPKTRLASPDLPQRTSASFPKCFASQDPSPKPADIGLQAQNVRKECQICRSPLLRDPSQPRKMAGTERDLTEKIFTAPSPKAGSWNPRCF